MRTKRIFIVIFLFAFLMFVTLLSYTSNPQENGGAKAHELGLQYNPITESQQLGTPLLVDHLNFFSEYRDQILQEAEWAMQQEPITVTAQSSPRSAGNSHDFFSEGDYWWPNPEDPSGPDIKKDGLTNPDNFVAHRHAMIRFSNIIGALAAAYKTTGDQKYAEYVIKHCKSWFVNSDTYMTPKLLYAQAVRGRFTGREIGIIDTIHLMEVAQGLIVMRDAINSHDMDAFRNWFGQYLNWITSHPYGIDEMNQSNNHGTCWTMQVACFAKLIGNQTLMKSCSDRYKTVLLPSQMNKNGAFPLELKRTKPYAYSLFNLDAMATICQILSTQEDNLWNYVTPLGKSIKRGIGFMYWYMKDKSNWPYPKDVMYWDDWPVAQPSLIFGGIAFDNKDWLNLWRNLSHTVTVNEVVRNLPIRHPLIWL